MAMSVWRRRRPSGVTIPLLERSVPPEIHYLCKTLEPLAARVRALRCTALHTEDICCNLGYGTTGRVPVHGARWWSAQIPNSAAAMPPRLRSATRQRLQLLLGDDLMVLFAAACAGRSRRLHTLSARFAMVSALMMAVAEALPKTTKIILEVRHGCRDRPSRLSS